MDRSQLWAASTRAARTHSRAITAGRRTIIGSGSVRRGAPALAVGLAALLALGACAADTPEDSEASLDLQAELATGPEPCAPDTEPPAATSRPPASTLALPTTVETPKVAPWFKVYRPKDLRAAGGPAPVVVWANGGCFRSSFSWVPLYERWASAGFIVLALDAAPGVGQLGTTGKKQHAALIDWILKQNETQGSPYFGAVDAKRVVAAGNSCGGVTALQVTAQDPRVAAVFVLSGSSALGAANKDVMGAIKVPVGYVVGGPQDIAGANAVKDYELLGAGIPAMIVSRSTGDHVTVSTNAMILPEVAKISLDWMDLALYGTPQAAATLSSETVCSGCQPGMWKRTSKNLESLAR